MLRPILSRCAHKKDAVAIIFRLINYVLIVQCVGSLLLMSSTLQKHSKFGSGVSIPLTLEVILLLQKRIQLARWVRHYFSK